MAKYLLLKHYRGGPAARHTSLDQWTAEEIDAHIAFQRHVGDVLRENGEFVDAGPERERDVRAL